MSDINVGQITEALNDKMDRDANNIESPRLPVFLVAKQDPSSTNSYTWYRKYSDGWVEQGGIHTFSTSSPHTVNLPITMADTKYLVLLTVGFPSSGDSTCSILARTDLLTTTTISIQKQWTSTNGCYYWQVSGMAAQ